MERGHLITRSTFPGSSTSLLMSTTTFCFYMISLVAILLNIVKILEKNKYLQEAVKIFHHIDADPENVISADQLFHAAQYSPKTNEISLNKVFYEVFSKNL